MPDGVCNPSSLRDDVLYAGTPSSTNRQFVVGDLSPTIKPAPIQYQSPKNEFP
jgi:hypothetical protein